MPGGQAALCSPWTQVGSCGGLARPFGQEPWSCTRFGCMIMMNGDYCSSCRKLHVPPLDELCLSHPAATFNKHGTHVHPLLDTIQPERRGEEMEKDIKVERCGVVGGLPDNCAKEVLKRRVEKVERKRWIASLLTSRNNWRRSWQNWTWGKRRNRHAVMQSCSRSWEHSCHHHHKWSLKHRTEIKEQVKKFNAYEII